MDLNNSKQKTIEIDNDGCGLKAHTYPLHKCSTYSYSTLKYPIFLFYSGSVGRCHWCAIECSLFSHSCDALSRDSQVHQFLLYLPIKFACANMSQSSPVENISMSINRDFLVVIIFISVPLNIQHEIVQRKIA